MKKYYFNNSASRTLLGEKVSEFKTTKIFSIDFSRIDNTLIVQYELIHHLIEGTATIHRWIDAMDGFQSKLVLAYNHLTQSITLENHSELQHKWYDGFKDKLKKEFKDDLGKQMIQESERLLNDKSSYQEQFAGYNLFRCFLNPIYYSEITNQEIRLKDYLGETDLNLITKTELLENNTFKNTAIIDPRLDINIINKSVRNLFHSHNIKADLEVEMEEIYVLDNTNIPSKVDLYLETNIISGLYSIINAHQVVEVNQEDFRVMVQKFEENNLDRSPFVID